MCWWLNDRGCLRAYPGSSASANVRSRFRSAVLPGPRGQRVVASRAAPRGREYRRSRRVGSRAGQPTGTAQCSVSAPADVDGQPAPRPRPGTEDRGRPLQDPASRTGPGRRGGRHSQTLAREPRVDLEERDRAEGQTPTGTRAARAGTNAIVTPPSECPTTIASCSPPSASTITCA